MISVHILLRFGLINLLNLCHHILDPRLLHQFVEKCGHLVIILAKFMSLMNNFFGFL